MKKISILLLFTLSVLTTHAAPPPGSFTLTFEDNFSGSKLDSTKWKVGQHHSGIGGSGGNNPENILLANGKLKLLATTTDTTYGSKNFSYSCGEISTFQNHRQKYGYWEARMRWSNQTGMWPAFWLMPDRGNYGGAAEQYRSRAYFKFDLSSAGIGYVSSAKLRVRVSSIQKNTNNLQAFKVDDDSWKESGSGSITWNNQPAWDARFLDQQYNNQENVGDYIDFDVRDFVATEITYGNKIVSLALADTFMRAKKVGFYSRENGTATNRPQLIINGNTYYPVADAHVRGGSNSNNNYGTVSVVEVYDSYGSDSNSSTYNGGMEVDIMETLGVWGANETSHVLHWDGYDYSAGGDHQAESWPDVPVSNTTGFHTYGFYWEPGLIEFYIDGVKTGSWSNSRVMSVPAYTILSLQLGGWPGSGNPVSSSINGKFVEVDYVRIYSGTATPSGPAGSNKIIANKHSSKALQPQNGYTFNDAEIRQANVNTGSNAQKWNIIDIGGGYYQIENKQSGKALRPLNGSTGNAVNIVQYTWNNWNSQKWKFIDAGSGYYQIQNKHSSKVLRPAGGSTANNANVVQETLNSGWNSQKWDLTP